MDVRTFENRRWSGTEQKREFRHRAALELIRGTRVLDIGCGDGVLLRDLAGRGIAGEGIDISDVAVARCRAEGLKVIQGNFAEHPLPFPDRHFDCAVLLDVLEHVFDPEALLGEAARVSSREVLISVPNFSSLPARLQTLFGRVPENNRPNKGHIYWFNWNTLSSMARRQGLVVIQRRMNAPWERIPLVGVCARMLANIFPNVFALSFVVSYAVPARKK